VLRADGAAIARTDVEKKIVGASGAAIAQDGGTCVDAGRVTSDAAQFTRRRVYV
jgi:hypothetical protein